MKFYLVKDEECDPIYPRDPGSLIFDVNFPFVNASPNDGDNILFSKFQKSFSRKFAHKKCDWSIRMSLFNPISIQTNPSGNYIKGMILSGEIFKDLHELLHGHCDDDLLKIKVKIEFQQPFCMFSIPRPGSESERGQVDTKNFFPMTNEDGSIDHSCYVMWEKVVFPGRIPNHKWSVSISISATDFISVDDLLPRLEETNRKILEERKLCDFTIISEDGTSIPCHKVFLSKSPVLLSMLEGGFEETKKNEMTMEDMTTQGVNALLEFLYFNGVNQAVKRCDIVLELLKAADKYDLAVLWKVTTTIIGAKPKSWYDVDVALKLYDFMDKCERDESPKLKKKMIQVLALKKNQLSTSTLFKELFPTRVSRDMFNLALETNHA